LILVYHKKWTENIFFIALPTYDWVMMTDIITLVVGIESAAKKAGSKT
jgi:hypothetical protein